MTAAPDLPQLTAALAERFRIQREIGRGGMALVYLAHDTKHHRQVALKILRPEIAAALGSDRFLQEIEIAACLAHPHILPLHDSGVAAGVLYYVMPYVTGDSLRDRLRRDAHLPLVEALRITREIADALDYAHGQGVVHRDIKPENVLFQAGHAVIADFGIARAITEAGGDCLTETGMALGTPGYMSPEQTTAEREVDGRSDIYSLGCVLYEMLLGEPPYTGPTALAILAKQLTDPVPAALRRLRDTVPAAVESALTRALAKDPGDRFASAGEFVEALTAPAGEADERRSVAVLPFLNIGADPENEYFADGITEDVITQLSRVGALKVICRTSVMPFRKREQGLQEIAARLRVRTVLDGSIRRSKERVRIVAQLIEVETGEQLWAETYDRELSDIFAIQSDVADHIAAALEAELSPIERTRLRKQPTTDMEAYHWYLRGRHCVLRYTPEGIRQGLQYFEAATARDPEYALAYTGIAVTWTIEAMGYGTGETRPADAAARAQENATRALQLDSELGDAHAVLGFVKFVFDFDWTGAERDFKHAFELNLNAGVTWELMWDAYGLLLSALQRYDEAIAVYRHARELDPLTAVHSSDIASAQLRAGRYDEAEREARQLLELHPEFPMGHSTLGWACLKQGRTEIGIAELARSVALSPGNTMLLAQLGQAYGMSGRTEDARQVLRQLEILSAQRNVSPYHLAYVYTGLDEQDRAIDCLERAYEERAAGVYGVKGSFLFTTLHSHPRFTALLRKLNLA